MNKKHFFFQGTFVRALRRYSQESACLCSDAWNSTLMCTTTAPAFTKVEEIRVWILLKFFDNFLCEYTRSLDLPASSLRLNILFTVFVNYHFGRANNFSVVHRWCLSHKRVTLNPVQSCQISLYDRMGMSWHNMTCHTPYVSLWHSVIAKTCLSLLDPSFGKS